MKKIFLLLATAFAALNVHAGWSLNQINGGLKYWLYTPSNIGAGPARLMINLHGCGSTADDYKALGNWEPAAEKYRMVVAVPYVPENSVVMKCWDSLSPDIISQGSHVAKLTNLVLALEARADLKIDRNQVFASGHSSGATQVMALACTRPDLIRGVGTSAGLLLGSSFRELFQVRTSASSSERYCLSLAGNRAGFFRLQRAVILSSDLDWVVNAEHSARAATAMAHIYGATEQKSVNMASLPGVRKAGEGVQLSDASGRARVLYLVNDGLGHHWPSGQVNPPARGKFINPDSLNLPLILADFFTR